MYKNYFLVERTFFYSFRGHHANEQLLHVHPHKVVSQVIQDSLFYTAVLDTKYSYLWCEATSAATAALGQPDRDRPIN